MPISYEEAMGMAPPAQAQDLPAGAITADQMFGEETPAAPSEPSTAESIAKWFGAGGQKYWDDYVKLSNQYAEALKEDSKADPKTIAGQLTKSGKTLLDLMGSAFSPLESAARTGIIEPVKAAVSKMSELAQTHLAAEDIYDPQKRREAWLLGEPVKQEYPEGIDWHVHQADVQRTAEGLNQFMETGVLTGVGFIGAKNPAEAMRGEAGEARLPLQNLTRLDPAAAVQALQGLKELSAGALEDLPGLKDSVEQLTANVKQLAIKDPNAVEAIAGHVEPVDKDLAEHLRKLSSEATEMKPEAQEALGERLAKPVLKQVGITAEGKPRVRVVPPSEGLASTVSEATDVLALKGPTPPEVVAAANKAYIEQLLREESAAKTAPAEAQAGQLPRGWDAVGGEAPSAAEMANAKDWGQLHKTMEPRYVEAMIRGRPIGAHTILDTMISHTKGDYQTEFLSKLRAHVDDVPVSFKPELRDALGNLKPNTQGHYRPASHDVEVKIYPLNRHPANLHTTHVVLHELVHAATINWMRWNENHPLMRELSDLFAEVKIKGGEELSAARGMHNSEEFIAEVFSNPVFQKQLSKIQVTGKSVMTKLTEILRKIFGMSPAATDALSRAISLGEGLMKEQKIKADRKTAFRETFGGTADMEKPRLRQVGRDAQGRPIYKSDDDSTILYHQNGLPVTRGSILKAFGTVDQSLEKIPGMPVILGKLKEYYRQIIQTVNPEAFGSEAKSAAAIIAKRVAQQMQKDSFFTHQAEQRRTFWNHRTLEQRSFIRKYEKGEKFDDPLLEKAALSYRLWNEKILNQDLKLGFDYEPIDNYLYHSFEDSKGVADFLTKRYGSKWNNPKFIKDRVFEMYDQGIAAGFKPRFTNPEDIMLARQHASDVAQMRVEVLQDLERFGLAVKVSETKPENFLSSEWRAPNGERYWVHDTAGRVMENAFNTRSLWTMPGIAGDAFRGAMWLKNTIVPIKLALSLFHPIHVATIDNATGMVRATKELLSGTMSPGRFVAEMAKATFYMDFISAPRMGSRILKAYQGKIKAGELSESDSQALQLMAEGGFIPEMSSQFRTKASQRFMDALQKRSAAALWHLPFAAMDQLQKPLFQIWIPSLKIASYLKDVQTAFRTDPTLLVAPLKRQVALRRIAKSVDNRYGEMAYNTLFWNRWVKDIAVADTLSLGWQMGFIREYGGGVMDLGQFATKEGSVAQKIKSGMLDRPLFVGYYTAQALAYGGLLTWALSGKAPQGLMDYLYPQNGEENPDGTPQRVTTMFYPREFAAIYKHMENEGMLPGLNHLAQNKASGVIGLTAEWATGVNSFGQEIRDPDAPAFKKLTQTLAYTLSGLEPISVSAIRQQASTSPVKTTVMNVAGFGPAPKYVTESPTEAKIKYIYQKYQAPRQTPYERARFSEDSKKLKRYYEAGDQDKYGDLINQMQEKYQLTPKDLKRLESKLRNDSNPILEMFSHLPWQQQKKLLDLMTDEERETYLPISNKDHLRYSYEPPEKN